MEHDFALQSRGFTAFTVVRNAHSKSKLLKCINTFYNPCQWSIYMQFTHAHAHAACTQVKFGRYF